MNIFDYQKHTIDGPSVDKSKVQIKAVKEKPSISLMEGNNSGNDNSNTGYSGNSSNSPRQGNNPYPASYTNQGYNPNAYQNPNINPSYNQPSAQRSHLFPDPSTLANSRINPYTGIHENIDRNTYSNLFPDISQQSNMFSTMQPNINQLAGLNQNVNYNEHIDPTQQVDPNEYLGLDQFGNPIEWGEPVQWGDPVQFDNNYTEIGPLDNIDPSQQVDLNQYAGLNLLGDPNLFGDVDLFIDYPEDTNVTNTSAPIFGNQNPYTNAVAVTDNNNNNPSANVPGNYSDNALAIAWGNEPANAAANALANEPANTAANALAIARVPANARSITPVNPNAGYIVSVNPNGRYIASANTRSIAPVNPNARYITSANTGSIFPAPGNYRAITPGPSNVSGNAPGNYRAITPGPSNVSGNATGNLLGQSTPVHPLDISPTQGPLVRTGRIKDLHAPQPLLVQRGYQPDWDYVLNKKITSNPVDIPYPSLEVRNNIVEQFLHGRSIFIDNNARKDSSSVTLADVFGFARRGGYWDDRQEFIFKKEFSRVIYAHSDLHVYIGSKGEVRWSRVIIGRKTRVFSVLLRDGEDNQ